MTDSKVITDELERRLGVRRDSEGHGDRRGLAEELFPGEEITQKDVGLEKDRRNYDRRSEKERRG